MQKSSLFNVAQKQIHERKRRAEGYAGELAWDVEAANYSAVIASVVCRASDAASFLPLSPTSLRRDSDHTELRFEKVVPKMCAASEIDNINYTFILLDLISKDERL